MVALLASVTPIKPRGSPPGFHTLPPRLCIYNLRRHPNSEGEGREGVRDHQRLPYAESGTADEARASLAHDGAQSITRWDDARQGCALPLRSGVVHQGGDGAFTGRHRCHS